MLQCSVVGKRKREREDTFLYKFPTNDEARSPSEKKKRKRKEALPPQTERNDYDKAHMILRREKRSLGISGITVRTFPEFSVVVKTYPGIAYIRPTFGAHETRYACVQAVLFKLPGR
ncbi:hypothetical protein PUN28_009664 [Cardiocondyla obscurior]|uniref:Uncharacterized protein n=1 Tax=Cardiocondyla obscurior TaxID=286306 RepID=A0AAW2FTD8_9HYME